jgi:signal transduction histidine kinase
MEMARILIADDEEDLVGMLAYHLKKRGYQIFTSSSGSRAWETIESEKPHLVILDLMMPELDGWEVCRLIRRSRLNEIRRMGILMLTARAMEEDRVYGLEIGADDYLTKPFSMAELILRVEKILRNSKENLEFAREKERFRFEMKSGRDHLRMLAHDLKGPLISMGASAKLLLRRDPQGDSLSPLKSIYINSVQLTQWVEEMSKAGQAALSDSKPEMEEIEIGGLVKRTLDLQAGLARDKDIELTFRSSPDHPAVRGNEMLLERAFSNLISNALKYTPRRGKVTVSVASYLGREEKGVVEVSVEDTGPGIHGEEIEKIFVPFYRGRNVSDKEGLGLGLAMVKEVAELHGGRILVHSEPNQGAIFSFLLPIHHRSGMEVKGKKEAEL